MAGWKRSLLILLGLLGSRAFGQGTEPGPGPSQTTKKTTAPQLFQPGKSSPATTTRPPVSMGKPVAARMGTPVALTDSINDSRIVPTSFDSKSDTANPGNSPIPALANPPVQGDLQKPASGNPMFAWKQSGDELAPPPRMENGIAPPPLVSPQIGTVKQGNVIPDPPPLQSVWTPEYDAGLPGYSHANIFKSNAFYIKTEALAWTLKGNNYPTLATTSGIDSVVGGNLGNKTTGGARLALGYWFDDAHLFGLEAIGFGMSQISQSQNYTTIANPNLSIPVLLANTGSTLLPLAGQQNGSTGGLSLHNTTKFGGAEINARTNWINGANGFVDLLAGVRYVGLDDNTNLSIFNSTGNGTPGSLLQRSISDQIQTKNQFFGGQIGSVAEYHFCNWVIDFSAKIAMGTTRESVNTNGYSVYSSPAGTGTTPGGLFTTANNMGRNVRNQFSVVPEAGVTLGYNFTDHLRGFCGYNFMYMSRVARPGQLLNTNVSNSQAANLSNTSAIPATGLPFGYQSGDFWAQGITLGLEWRY